MIECGNGKEVLTVDIDYHWFVLHGVKSPMPFDSWLAPVTYYNQVVFINQSPFGNEL